MIWISTKCPLLEFLSVSGWRVYVPFIIFGPDDDSGGVGITQQVFSCLSRLVHLKLTRTPLLREADVFRVLLSSTILPRLLTLEVDEVPIMDPVQEKSTEILLSSNTCVPFRSRVQNS